MLVPIGNPPALCFCANVGTCRCLQRPHESKQPLQPPKPALQDLDSLRHDAAQTLLKAAQDGTLAAVLSKKTGKDGRGQGGRLSSEGNGLTVGPRTKGNA